MVQYILLIHGNVESEPAPDEWNTFFAVAQASGLFRGGSAIGSKVLLGNATAARSTNHIVGYMRFDADDRQQLLELLEKHPVVVHGGSVELCEMPKQ